MKACIYLGATILLCGLALALYFAWQSERRGRAQLQLQLSTAQKQVDTLSQQQESRDAQLQATLKGLERQKRAVKTPQQAATALAALANLPKPIVIVAPGTATRESDSSASETRVLEGTPARGSLTGRGDLRAEVDALLDQAKNRVASTMRGITEQPGTPVMPNQTQSTKPGAHAEAIELDAGDGRRPTRPGKPADGTAQLPGADLKPLYDFAVDCQACKTRLAAAQGGSAWRRVARAAKWLAIGAAAGALAVRASR